MPARILHGEAMWGSHKLANVEPPWVRPEYAWLYPLAGSNSVFELDARAIWARCYAFNRPERPIEEVKTILAAFERAKLLFTWEQNGKRWGYWTGSEKPGRRPRPSWIERDRDKGKLGPDPPGDQLRRFLAEEPQRLTRDQRATDTPEACSLHASSVPGSGSGSGSGFGCGLGSGGASHPQIEGASHIPAPVALSLTAPAPPQQPGEPRPKRRPREPSPESPPGFEEFWQVYPKKRAKQDARRAWRKVRPEDVPAILAAVERWKRTEDWQRENGRFIPYPATFVNGGRWQDEIPEIPAEHSQAEQVRRQARAGAGPAFSSEPLAARLLRAVGEGVLESTEQKVHQVGVVLRNCSQLSREDRAKLEAWLACARNGPSGDQIFPGCVEGTSQRREGLDDEQGAQDEGEQPPHGNGK